jgi:hypothetical protein
LTNLELARANDSQDRAREGNLGKLLNDEKFFNDTHAAVENVRTITGARARRSSADLLLKDEPSQQRQELLTERRLNTTLEEIPGTYRPNSRSYKWDVS